MRSIHEHACYHCGEMITPANRYALPLDKDPLASEEGDEKLFCCKGCLQVYLLIHSSGNASYYTYRTEFAPTVDKDTTKMPYEVWDAEITADENQHKKTSFLIQGIHCASCVWLNEQVLVQTEGIISAEVHLATNRAYLTWDSTKINMRKIAEIISSIGYIAIPVHKTKEEEAKKASRSMLMRLGVAGFFMGNIMLFSVSLYAGYFAHMDFISKTTLHWVSWLFATPILFYSAGPFFKNAWHSLKQGFLSMDFLTAAALSLAYFYSVYVTLSGRGETYFEGLGFVTFAILIGRMVETSFKSRSLYYLENLGQSLPKSVHVLSKDQKEETDVPVEKVQKGDVIVVYPGEIVAFDGLLLKEHAEVDESMITGEYRPVEKDPGDEILSGSRCLATAIWVEVDSTAEENTLTNIARMAEQNMNKMPDIQALAEKVSRYFIIFVFVAGISTFLFWWGYLKGGVEVAIVHTISLLIAACPCALNLSIPTAFIVALQKASSLGILVQGGPVLEAFNEIDVVALDKTGTATYGNMRVEKTFMGDTLFSQKQVEEIAVAIEKASGIHHPIAMAFLDILSFDNTVEVFSFENIAGRGLRAKTSQGDFIIGSESMMKDFSVSNVIDFRKQKDFTQDATPVYLAEEKEGLFYFVALFQLHDTIRPETASVIKKLKSYGKQVVLLTGDNKMTAETVAQKIGVDECISQVSPSEKQDYISTLQAGGKKVAMVGDGMNDAVALARADIGISFAGASEISIYSSDVLLLRNNIKSLDNLFRLAQQMRQRLRENLTLSFVYNTLLIPLAFAGLIIPLVGAVAMSISSIVVVVNSLRLYRFKEKI